MKIFQKNELKLLWPFYLEYFLASVLYLAPVFWTFYFLDLGFSIFQIAIVFAASQLATLLFEIPTGSFADLYGRKFSVLVGYSIECLCMFSLFFAKSYLLVVLIFVVLGIGGTFSSGSKDAWIVDLLNKKSKNLISPFFNKQQVIIQSGLFFSGLLGALVVKFFGLSSTWLFSTFSYLLSIFLIGFFTKEVFEKKQNKEKTPFKDLIHQTKISLHYSYKHPVLSYYLLAGIIFVFASMLQIDISWIPLLKELGMKDYSMGLLWSAMSIVMAISPILAIKLLKKGKERNFMILAIILGAITNLFIVFSSNLYIAIPILILSLFFFYSKNPIREIYLHKFVPSNLRATIGSIRSMITALASIIALPVAGWLISSIGPRYTIFLSSFIMIPAIVLYLKIREESSPKKTAIISNETQKNS